MRSQSPGEGPTGEPVPSGQLPGFDGLYGLELLHVGEDEVRARVRIGDQHRQPAGLVHGGVIAAMAETMASLATHLAVRDSGHVAQGLSNHASFVRPLVEGHVHAVAHRRHRGRSTWIWEVEVSDDAQRLCALVRMTVAVRPAAGGAQPGL